MKKRIRIRDVVSPDIASEEKVAAVWRGIIDAESRAAVRNVNRTVGPGPSYERDHSLFTLGILCVAWGLIPMGMVYYLRALFNLAREEEEKAAKRKRRKR